MNPLPTTPMDATRRWPISRMLPFVGWWPMVEPRTLRADLLAGFTGALIVLPQGVAFATIAGLPPQYGLYTAMVPAVIAALFGSSWHLVSGPTTAISIVVFGALTPLAEPGTPEFVSLALTLTFLVGAIQLAMGLARLGALAGFISHTVVIGFTAGAGILIASNQLKHFLGVEVPRGASFYRTLEAVALHARDIDPWVTSVGVVTLVTGIVVRRWFRRFPYLIAAILAGSVAGAIANALYGPAVTHIRTVGALPAALPPLSYPALSLGVVKQLGANALALSLLALTEAVSIARAVAVRSEQRIDGNQEFIGQGLANIVGSFFSSYASSGSFNRSGVNFEAGARTPLAAAFSSVFLAAIVLLVAPLAVYLPVAAMAGILFLVAYGLVDFRHIRGIARTSRSETVVLAATFLATLFLELEYAIYVGVILSLVLYLRRTSRPAVHALVPDARDPRRRVAAGEGRAECSQLKIVEVRGSLFFGAIDHVVHQLHQIDARNPRHKHVLLVADSVNFVDVAGAEMLAQEARRRRRLGGGLYLVGLKERALQVLRAGGYLEEIGEQNVFDTDGEAIARIARRLDADTCQVCEGRVFRECPEALRHGLRRPAAARLEAAMSAAAYAEEGAVDAARGIMVEAAREAAEARRAEGGPDDDDDAPPEPRRRSGAA